MLNCDSVKMLRNINYKLILKYSDPEAGRNFIKNSSQEIRHCEIARLNHAMNDIRKPAMFARTTE